jgi:hypothetical protein
LIKEKLMPKMSRLRTLSLLAVAVALLAALAVPVLAADPVFSPLRGTVTIDGADAPAGTTVAVFVGTEVTARASVTTTIPGYYEVVVMGEAADVGKGLRLEVNGVAAMSTPTSPTFTSYQPQVVALAVYIEEEPPVRYNLTISIHPAGWGSTQPAAGTHPLVENTNVTITATALNGYAFSHWSGDAAGTDPTITVTMNADHAIIANFEVAEIPPVECGLTISCTTGGLVTEPGVGPFTYDAGEVVALMAEPGDGYWFVIWTGDVATIASCSAASTTIVMNGDYSVTATFQEGVPPPVLPELDCFIATAAYGTPMAGEIQVLREFRDRYMLTNPVGQALVDFYYEVSPPVAEFIAEHPGLKPVVRAGLMPAVTMSTVVVNTTILFHFSQMKRIAALTMGRFTL